MSHITWQHYGNRMTLKWSHVSCPAQSPDRRTPELTKVLKAHEDNSLRDLSSCTPGRPVSPEIRDEVQDARIASRSPSGCQSSYHGYHTYLKNWQHQSYIGTSESAGDRIGSHIPHQSTDAQPSGLASPSEPSEDVPIVPQVSASSTPQPPPSRSWTFAQPSPSQPLPVCFPPYAILGHQTTNHVYTNPPTNVPLTLLPHFISWIDEAKVREYLAIAVVRHKDIHDMVEREYERIAKERQDRINEDASVLSFVKEHIKVQQILYEEYDDFPISMRSAIFHQALGSINQTIMAIPPHVRPSSNWKTKFNALLTLIWIGRGIVDGIGMLPNAIKSQMAVDSQLVAAIRHVSMTMSEPEILDDGARLLEALIDLDTDRENCFEGLEKVVQTFQEVMRQGTV